MSEVKGRLYDLLAGTGKAIGGFVESILGPDDDGAVESALKDEDEREGKVSSLKPTPDFTVEVMWDEEAEVFRARIKTKFMPEAMELSIEGDTPGEALTMVGMTIDTSLARRGFGRAKK